MISSSHPDTFPEERCLATVLSADLQGFYALVEQQDVEAVSGLIKEVWLRLDQVIVDFGGYIDKHIGDEIMAVWGVPKAGEDDAQRALACALGLQESLKDYANTSYRPGAGDLQLKIGVHSGQVLATHVGLRSEYTIIGDTVNVAKRLTEIAEAGSVLISQATYRLVRGAFRVRRREALKLRGRTDPVTGYFVDQKLAQPARVRYQSEGGLDTNLVGRENEIATLLDLLDALHTAADPFLALLVGQTGMGKSRVLMEFSSRAEVMQPGLNMISVRGLVEAEKAPFFLWKSLWKDRFSITEDMTDEKACEQFLRGVLQVWGKRLGAYSAVEAAHLVGDLVGLNWKNSPYLKKYADDPAGRNRRAFELTREIFLRLAGEDPLVLMIDDFDWVDQGSLDLLRFLLQAGDEPLPLFVLAGVRPEFFDFNLAWKNAAYRLITLAPLDFDVRMVRAAYPVVEKFPDALLARMAVCASGTPLFLEELVKSLVQTGGDLSQAPAPPSIAHPLPENLQALLQARMASLPSEAREVLQLASVTGRTFWVGALKAAAKQPVGTGILNLPDEVLDRVIQSALRQIVRAELAFPRAGSIFNGEQEYLFKHQLLQEVAYDSLPKKYLKFYHFAVAKWLSDRGGPDFNVMIAGHYERAGNTSSALRHYQFALNYARARGANTEGEWLEGHIRNIRRGEHAAAAG